MTKYRDPQQSDIQRTRTFGMLSPETITHTSCKAKVSMKRRCENIVKVRAVGGCFLGLFSIHKRV